MAYKANILRKLKKIILRRIELFERRETRSAYSQQIGKLLEKSNYQFIDTTSKRKFNFGE